MEVAIFARGALTDSFLRWAAQLGVNALDDPRLPGLRERGYPDLNELGQLVRRIRAHGLRINRVTLPPTDQFMRNQDGGEAELDNICTTIECLGKVGIPIGRPVFPTETPPVPTTHMAEHRGGYRMRAVDLVRRYAQLEEQEEPALSPEDFWTRCCEVYRRIIPVAEDSGVKLALHPSDIPLPHAPFDTVGYRRVVDAFPSAHNGLLYCIGTRYEAGGTRLVLDEINHYGRKGKLFEVHFRNVVGTLPSANGFEEVLLDDGDMNMYEIIQALARVGFDGAINPDHMPLLEGDTPDRRMAWSYSVGYVKALLAALAAQP